MPLVPERGDWGQEEGAGDYGGEERKTEEEERVAGERSPVDSCPGIMGRGRAELIGLERWHICGG